MSQRIPLSWLQLKHERMKLFAAVAGVMVSVVLMWMQLGLMKALFVIAVVFHGSVNGDLVIVHSQYEHLLHRKVFSSRLLHRLQGSPDVSDVHSVYLAPGEWKNPWNGEMRSIQCYGIETDQASLNLPGIEQHLRKLRNTDVFLYDRMARPRFGNVAGAVAQSPALELEINRCRMSLAGLVDLGASFGVDGNVLVSHANFLRLFPSRKPGEIDVSVVKLRPDISVVSAQEQFQILPGKEVQVLTAEQFKELELIYWRSATPIGIIFTAGTVVAFFIGFIVVYQILYTDVTNHLPQYATMKAMGFSDGYLYQLVLGQSVQLATMGFIPGSLIAALMYAGLRKVTQLPLYMDPMRGVILIFATHFHVYVFRNAGRSKTASADPADVF